MNRLLVIFICFIIQAVQVNAQNSNRVDSLIIELDKAKGIEEIQILIQLSDLYKTSDPFKSYTYAREALRISELRNYQLGQILAHENIGVFFQYTAQYSNALENYFRVNELIEEIDGVDLLLMRNNNLLGEVYRDLEEYSRALEYYNSAFELSIKTGDFDNQIVIKVNIALTYMEIGNLDSALIISKETLEISEKRDYLFGIMISLYNIGLVNSHLEENDLALEYYYKLENLVEQYGEQIGTEFILGKIKLYQAIAESSYSQNNYEAAHEYAIKCWDIASNSDFMIDFKEINDFLYKYYLDRNNYESALKYFELSYKAGEELSSERNNRQVLLLEILEKERKDAIAMNLEQQERDRRYRLEYFGISIVILIGFLIANIFWRLKISRQLGQAIIFLSLLLLFEFVLILIDPSLELHTSGEPIYKMMANSVLAVLFTFLHRFFEKKITSKISNNLKLS